MSMELTEASAEIGTPTNPFPGLRPFDFEESHLFFGRDGQSEQLISKLGRTRFLAVVGTSGSGKSSLVRAGFLPALLGGFMTSAGSGWRIAVLRPGNDPIGNLAQALNAPDVFGSEIEENAAIQIAITEANLRRGSRGLVEAVQQNAIPDNENLLVLVDQFEELFRFAREAARKTKDEAERYQNDAAAFVKLLLEAHRERSANIYVVLTMRSDFLGDCARFWDLPETVNESQYLITRLTRDQLREAITGPIAVGGGKISARLVSRLLNEVGDDQDQLPVLQHLLMRVWDELKEKRLEVEVKDGETTLRKPHNEVHEGEAMDLCCYEAVGGMAEALSRHAEEAFNELPDDRHRQIAEKLFKSLTERGEDNREIRRPVTLGEICAVAEASAAEVRTIIETFRLPSRSFLMPPAGTALEAGSLIDISHESLIRCWRRLREWVIEEAESARMYRRVIEDATAHDKDQAELWRGLNLQRALVWRDHNKPNKAWAARYHPDFENGMSFLTESVSKCEADELTEKLKNKKETRRKRFFVAALLLALLGSVSTVLTVYAFSQRAVADSQRRIAEAQREEADHQRQEAEKLGEEASHQERMAGANAALALRQKKEAEQSAKDALEQKRIAQASQEKAQLALAELRAQKLITDGALVAASNALKERDLAFGRLSVEKEAAVRARDEATKARDDLDNALKDVREQKKAADQARDRAEKAREAADNALADLTSEKQRYKAVVAEQETLLTSIKDASPAGPSTTGKLKFRLKDAYGEFLDEPVDIALRNESGAGGTVSMKGVDASKVFQVDNLTAGARGIYQLSITSSSYLPVRKFISVKENAVLESQITLALDLSKIDKVKFPKFEDLPTEARALLSASGKVEGYEGKTGEDLYMALDDLRRAELLNIIAKCRATSVQGSRSALSYLRELRRIGTDRVFAVTDNDLRATIRDSEVNGLFRPAPDTLHTPPAGFEKAGSWRTRDEFASVQLTFFFYSETWIAEIGINAGGGLAQAFSIFQDKLTSRGIHPYEIHQLLLVQHIDPGYRLKL